MVFVESRVFTKRLADLARTAADEVLSAIQRDLLNDPERGDVVQGTGGLRKARVANPARQKGSRGGFRYLYLYLQHRGRIQLLYLLDKGEQEDLSSDERKMLRAMVERIGNVEQIRG